MGSGEDCHNVVGHMRRREHIAFAVLVALVLVGVGLDLSDQPLYERFKGFGLIVAALLFFYSTVPPTLRCAAAGVKSVWSVCGASVVHLIVFLVVFYTAFFWIADSLPETVPAPSDKLLNFPPMVAALWAAGMGWYVHFQASAKNHRTTNSFNLLMQTRTSSVFLERARTVQLTFPHGSNVAVADKSLFESSVLSMLAQAATGGGADAADAEKRLELATAADALKYLLNYYEFMAVGIEAKDLDENLLYDTISVTVTSMYHRAEPFITHLRKDATPKQPLAFDSLEALVKRWDARLRDEIHQKTTGSQKP